MSLKSSDEAPDVPIPTPQQNTQFHLAAVSISHPPSPWTIKKCTCEKQLPGKPAEQSQHIRLYYAEPSYYDHTPGCFLIKENRFSDAQGWYAPSDGLVADDAVAGSPITAIGWWDASDDGLGFKDPWETRVYYVDRNGNLRERINHSYFDPSPKDDFDSELPKPEELVPPTPGWILTPLSGKASKAEDAVNSFPVVNPHPIAKISAVRTDKGEIYLFYQSSDLTIRALVSTPGKGWVHQESPAVCSGQVQAGTALAAVAGGWSEVRLFYITSQNTLGEVYERDGEKWTESELPPYKVMRTTMLAAVAWNHATPFFQIRVYATGGKEEVQEYSFSRNSGGWMPPEQLDSSAKTNDLAAALYPVSAVAAAMLGDGCSTKVYFHPRRFVAEWDSCTKRTFPSTLTTVSERFEGRRQVEHETRVKIAEEEERKRREEEARKQREEEARKQREAEEEKRKQEKSRQTGLPALSGEDLRTKERLRATPVGVSVELKGTVLEKIMKVSNCKAGFRWMKTETGWQCAKKGHELTDEEFDAL